MSELLQRETPKVILGLQTAQILIQLITEYVYQTPVQDMADLRQCSTDTWNGLSQSTVDGDIDE